MTTHLHRSRWILLLVLASCGGDDDATTSGAATTAMTASTSTGATLTGTESTGASTSATGSMSADTGPQESSTGGAESTGSTGAADTAVDTSGTSTGGGEFATCTADRVCPDGTTCRLSMCCDGVGFCAAPDVPKCGGFVGMPCEGGQVCVTDVCVADGDGECLDPDDAAALEAAQPTCWNIG